MYSNWAWATCLTLVMVSIGQTASQTVMASNSTSDIYPYNASPRFLLNASEPQHLTAVPLAPLGPYAQGESRGEFLAVHIPGNLFHLTTSNADQISSDSLVYMSCDESFYANGNLSPTDLFNIVFNNPHLSYLILYSEFSKHCNVSDLNDIQQIEAVLTTTDRISATALANFTMINSHPGQSTIYPDTHSYTNVSNGWTGSGAGLLGPSPTTAVAMIILYSITGLITALFVIIIATGAVRAHRHPERYGPRNIVGRGRQSRAKGIARAMLETLPIVKFGDHQDLPVKPNDVEMNDTSSAAEPAHAGAPAADSAAAGPVANSSEHQQVARSTDNTSSENLASVKNADGTDAEGHLGCSICTEDFTKGEEVRVLPCNHKFHPDCVDPWLLNVSGTCPLCRIDLRPKGEAAAAAEDAPGVGTVDRSASFAGSSAELPPPLDPGARRDTMISLRNVTSGTREERIAALRRYRDEHQRRGSVLADGGAADRDRSRRLRDRLRDRLRVRTTRSGMGVAEETEEDTLRRLERQEWDRERVRRGSRAGDGFSAM